MVIPSKNKQQKSMECNIETNRNSMRMFKFPKQHNLDNFNPRLIHNNLKSIMAILEK